MWQVDVPLAEFYSTILDAAKQAEYLAVITALVREADSDSFYEDISRYWDSLHDVTGPDVLFVLAGPDAASKVGSHGVPDYKNSIAYSTQNAAVKGNTWRELRPNFRHWAPRSGTSAAPPVRDLIGHQTRAVGDLRRRLAVPESRIPCLHLALLDPDYKSHSSIIPLSSRTVYDTVKHIVAKFEESFGKIRRMNMRLKQLEDSQYHRSGTSSYRPSSDGKTPEQIDAARAIVAVCDTTPSSLEAIAAARRECFRYLAVLKGTSDFPVLQRHIDIQLDLDGKVKEYRSVKERTETRNALATTWTNAIQLAGDIDALSISPVSRYRAFIAYESASRWIAESLHSALVQHVSTFLDVHCLQPGDRWVERIRSAQDNAEITVLLIGKSVGTSWFQQAEYLRAIELARTQTQRIVPIYLRGSAVPAPYGLEGVQGIITKWEEGLRQDEVRKVAADIAALLPSK